MEDELQWKMTSNGRWPPMEDDLKILKVKYFRNHFLDHTQISNLSLDCQPIFYKSSNEDNLQLKTTSKYCKLNISATTY